MQVVVTLTAQEIVHERLFTHPSYILYDYRTLFYMIKRLHKLTENALLWEHRTEKLLLQQVEPDERQHRIILCRPWQLQPLTDLVLVGFFGQRRPDGDAALIGDRDRLLADEMDQHPGLVSYCSLELTNGDYANCVLFVDEEAKNRWGAAPQHAQIASEVSPHYYYSVRLYNGYLHGGLQLCKTQPFTTQFLGITENSPLRLTCVKYYDYSYSPTWRAIRYLESS